MELTTNEIAIILCFQDSEYTDWFEPNDIILRSGLVREVALETIATLTHKKLVSDDCMFTNWQREKNCLDLEYQAKTRRLCLSAEGLEVYYSLVSGSSPKQSSILAGFGFSKSPYSAGQERNQCDHETSYKKWDIFFLIPNGGIIACVICQENKAYQFPVGSTDKDWKFYFDYLDDEGILSHAKKAIDSLTEAIQLH